MNLLKPEPCLRRGFKDKKHRDKVGNLACLCCIKDNEPQKSPVEVHHLWGIGAGQKASDRLCFGICNLHHTGSFTGPIKGITLHENLEAFEESYGTQDQLIKETYQMLGLEELYESYNIILN